MTSGESSGAALGDLLQLEARIAEHQKAEPQPSWHIGELIASIKGRELWRAVSRTWGEYRESRKYRLEEPAIWENFTLAEFEQHGKGGKNAKTECIRIIRESRRPPGEAPKRRPRRRLQEPVRTELATPKVKKPTPAPKVKAEKLVPRATTPRSSMRQILLDLHAGKVSFQEFATSAKRDIRALAGSLFRSWQVPSSISPEDLEQEMLLAAWQAVARWDPAKASINGFVVFTMCDRAKKLIHKERAALRRDGKAQSRHAVPMSTLTEDGSFPEFAKTLWSEDQPSDLPVLLGVPREREFAQQTLDQLRCELQRSYPQHDRAIAALFAGRMEKDRAARLLYSDPDAAVPSLGMARRLVKAAAASCGLEVK